MSFNDSFGPLEDNNPNNLDPVDSSYKVILLKLMFEKILKILCKAIENRITINKQKVFLIIKKFSLEANKNKPHIKDNEYGIKQKLIIDFIKYKLKNLLYIYKRKIKEKQFKYFLKWKNVSTFQIYFCKSKLDIENYIEKNLTFKKKELEGKIKEKENEISLTQNKLQNVYESNSNYNKKLKVYEVNKKNYLDTIKTLEDDKSKTEEKLKISKMEVKLYEDNRNKLEAYHKELEENVKSLKEQIQEKDNHLNIYIREMNEMLEVFEKNSANIFAKEDEDKQEEINRQMSINKYASNNSDYLLNGVKSPTGSLQKSSFKITSIPSNLILKKASKANLGGKNNIASKNMSLSNNSSKGILNTVNSPVNIMSQLSNILNISQNKMLNKNLGISNK